MSAGLQVEDSLAAASVKAAGRTARWLLERQHPEGFWRGEVSAEAPLEADWLLWQFRSHAPDRARMERAKASLLDRQLPGGGYAVYPGGPAELNASIKAYCALKLAGVAALTQLRETVLRLGGLEAADADVRKLLEAQVGFVSQELIRGDSQRRQRWWARLFTGRGTRMKSEDRPDLIWLTAPQPALEKTKRTEAERRLEELVDDDGARFRIRPLWAPVRDTALAALVLGLRAGQAEAWLRERVADAGSASDMETATAVLALRGQPPEAVLRWLRSRQAKDGGWGSCADTTGRVLEALCACGAKDEAVERGVAYLLRSQDQRDGSWAGRWSVNRIFGTCLALRGLRAWGYDEREAEVLRAGEWLRSVQNADGGWGESCASDAAGTFVEAASTPSQTAWALLGLMAGGDAASQSVEKGIEYLIGTQDGDGGWRETAATGIGFPGGLYLQYEFDRVLWPVLALSEFAGTRSNGG